MFGPSDKQSKKNVRAYTSDQQSDADALVIPEARREHTTSSQKESNLSDHINPDPSEAEPVSKSLEETENSANRHLDDEYTAKLETVIKNFSMVLNIKPS